MKAKSTRSELLKLFELEASSLDLRVDVFSDGPISSSLAIVGEGPGEQEIRQSLPFVGGSGTFLWNEARKYDITRINTYVTNVVKRQISLSSQGNARHAVNRPELSKWISLVQWELSQLPNLRYVFLMGNFALEAFCPDRHKITDHRGSVLDGFIGSRPVKFVLAFNPAYVLREPKNEPIFKMDMHKLSRVINGTWKEHVVRAIINPSIRDIHKYLDHLDATKSPVSVDIETCGTEIACYGVSNDPHEAMCINLRDDENNRFSSLEEARLLQRLNKSFKSNEIVCHNGIFDSYYTWLKSRLRFKCTFDTMLAHHLLTPQLPHALAFLVAQYTTHPFYKDEGKNWKEGGDINVWWTYNCKDAALTLACRNSLARSLEKHDLLKFFKAHIMRLQPHLVQATVHGVGCDLKLKEVLKEKVSEDVAEARAEFDRLVLEATAQPDYLINPNSPAQLGDLLFSRLKLRGRGISTDETNRTRIINDPRTPPIAKEILSALTIFKKEKKFLGTYLESRVDSDGRVRTVYRQHGVARAPGRLSSAQTIDKTGMNLQNQPQRAYEMFVADPNTVFIYLDGSQAEARIVGWYYDIEKWKEDFERARRDRSYDCHRALAAQMFKIPYDQTPTKDFDKDHNKTKRYIAKRCRHGLNYRMQADRLSEVTELPYHEARRAFHLYHSITPELRRGWAKVEETVKRTRELYNAYGRRWKVIQRLDEKVLESIIAFYPQSTMGDHVCRAWYMSEEDPKWPKGQARIAMNIHDALVGISTPKHAKTALAIMRKHMEHPILITNVYSTKTEKLIIPAECKISRPDKYGVHRWSGLEEVEL